MQVIEHLLQVLHHHLAISRGVGRYLQSQPLVHHTVANAIPCGTDRSKPAYQQRVCGECAGREDDVVHVGIARILEQGHLHIFIFCQHAQSKQVTVKS